MNKPKLKDIAPPTGWSLPAHIRLPPLDVTKANFWQRTILTSVRKVGRLDAGNLWLMLMHNVRLMSGFLSFVPRLMPYGELDRRDTELVILRVGWNCRCRYEWSQHVDIGIRAGLTQEEVMRVPQGPDAPGWTPQQAAVLRAADEIHSDRIVSESTWLSLTEFFNQRLLLELLMLIGMYEGLSGVLNSSGLPIDASLERRMMSFG